MLQELIIRWGEWHPQPQKWVTSSTSGTRLIPEKMHLTIIQYSVLYLLGFVKEFAFHVIAKVALLSIICSPTWFPHRQCHQTRWVYLSTKMFLPGEEKVMSCVRDWPDGNETHFLFLGTQEEDISQPPLLLAWSYGRALVIEKQLKVEDTIFVSNYKTFWKIFHIFHFCYSADLKQRFVSWWEGESQDVWAWIFETLLGGKMLRRTTWHEAELWFEQEIDYHCVKPHLVFSL